MTPSRRQAVVKRSPRTRLRRARVRVINSAAADALEADPRGQ